MSAQFVSQAIEEVFRPRAKGNQSWASGLKSGSDVMAEEKR